MLAKKTTKKAKSNKKSSKKVAKKSQIALPSSWTLLKESADFISKHYKKLLGIAAVLFVLYLIMVRSASSFNVDETRGLIQEQLGSNELLNSAIMTGIIIGSGGSSQTSASSLGAFLLFVVGSLAIIWALRHLVAQKDFRIRDAYYKGMYPLIPFILVIFLMSIQLIPFVVGGFLYSTAEINGLIGSLLERGIFIAIWIVLGLLSAYWLANSLMSMYAATLPDIYPMQALRSTKDAVKGRRWIVFRKIFVLLLAILVVFGGVLISVVALVPAAAVIVYDLLVVLGLLFAHTYLFKLYRSLI